MILEEGQAAAAGRELQEERDTGGYRGAGLMGCDWLRFGSHGPVSGSVCGGDGRKRLAQSLGTHSYTNEASK